MPTFSNAAFQSFIGSFKQAFTFIIEALHGLIEVIKANPLYFVPLFLVALLAVAFWVGWLIMEVAPNASGTPYGNPYGYFANPNKQFETKMPNVTSLGRHIVREHERKKREQQKIQDATDRLEIQSALYRQNKIKADEYFRNNPNAFKINIDGQTFWREDWEKKHYGKSKKSNNDFQAHAGMSYDEILDRIEQNDD